MLTDLAQANFWWTAIRRFWAFFDKFIYSIMAFVYEVFLNVASQNILGGAVAKALVGRMQLIVGIIFLFIFAINIVQGIVNPDRFTDKDNGTSKLIIKVLVSLCLISTMIPLNIPGADNSSSDIIYANDMSTEGLASSGGYKWEQGLAEQGILFGTLTFFQNKVLETNVLGKLILGNNASDYDTMNNGSIRDEEATSYSLSNAGDYMATEILKKFITPNQQSDYILKENEETINPGDPIVGGEDDGFPEGDDTGYICSGTPEFSDAVEGRLGYYQEEYDVSKLFGYIDNTCTLDGDKAQHHLGDEDMQGDYYMFAYMGGFSTLVGGFVVVVLVSFTLEIAVRVFKLLILRIMGPIAAVGYIMPNTSSGNVFSIWAKQVAVTFADIFIRLAIIYFSILVVSGLLSEGLSGIYNASTGVGFVTVIFLVIAVFLFAKQAPKFIKKLFGINDDDGKGLFSGLVTLAGLGAVAAGSLGSAYSRAASRMGSTQGSGLKKAAAGLAGGVGGFLGGLATGGRAFLNADKNQSQAVQDAVQNRNLLKAAQDRAHVKPTDMWEARMRKLFGLESAPDYDQRMIQNYKNAGTATSALAKMLRDAGVDYGKGGNEKVDVSYGGLDYSGEANDWNEAFANSLKNGGDIVLNGRNYGTAADDRAQQLNKLVTGAAGGAWARKEIKKGKAMHTGLANALRNVQDADLEGLNVAPFTDKIDSYVKNQHLSREEARLNTYLDADVLEKSTGASNGTATRMEMDTRTTARDVASQIVNAQNQQNRQK